MPAGSVLAYQAALETTNTAMSYAMEAQWAVAPATTFQGMRILSDSLAHKKTRIRPGEIRGDRQSPAGLTTQEIANGSIVFPSFYAETGRQSQLDSFLESALGGDWQPASVITGTAGDISLNASGALTSTTANKFADLRVSQVVKLNGFTNTANNGLVRVVSIVSGQSLQVAPLGFAIVTETPAGTAAKISYSNLRNGTFFKSIFLQQRLDPGATKWFRYPGSYVTKLSMALSLGQFLQCTADVTAQQELKGITDVSVGGIVPPPNTREMDPVAGFRGAFWNDQFLTSGINSANFDFTNDGAAGEYFLGSPYAQGMMGGTFMASAKIDVAFKDFTRYDDFRSETEGVSTVIYGDLSGNLYVVTTPRSIILFDSGVPVTGPNRMLMASATLEANPDTASGCTVSIDRLPATA